MSLFEKSFSFNKLSLAQLRLPSGCVRLWQIFRASLIRGAKDLGVWLQASVATGANEHPCAVAPLGYIPVPELPACAQVQSTSNAFAFISVQRRTSSKMVVELCKDSFHQERKSFSFRDSLFCDSFLLPPLRPACLSHLRPSQRGQSMWQKERPLWLVHLRLPCYNNLREKW